jgi:hypothetical protein
MKGLAGCGALLSFCAAVYAGEVFEKVTSVKGAAYAVVASGDTVYAGVDDTLYRRESGDAWVRVAALPRPQACVRDVAVWGGNVYVAADDGVYRVGKSRSLEKVFAQAAVVDGAESEEGQGNVRFFSLYAGKDELWAGSDHGLYVKSSAGFDRVEGITADTRVMALGGDQVYVYAATDKGVYTIDRITRVCSRVMSAQDDGAAARALARTDEAVYVGTMRGVRVSRDNGATWQTFAADRLHGMAVNALTVGYESVVVSGESGAWKCTLSGERCERTAEGLRDAVVNDAAIMGDELVLATADGLYEATVQVLPEPGHERVPPIAALRSAVIRYNELSPDKIAAWRKRYKASALLPTFSADYDQNMYGTAGTSTYDGRHYRAPHTWGVGVSWDASRLVWDDDETSIDNRSRLNTQLRIDILDEVTRLYFERKRAAAKLSSLGDAHAAFPEHQLRVDELTAAIDAYCGGWFSDAIESGKE